MATSAGGSLPRRGDLEGAVGHGAVLADELVKPLVGEGAVAFTVHVATVIIGGRLAVQENLEAHGGTGRLRSHDQVKVAGVEAVGDLSAGSVRCGGLFSDRPVRGQGPVVQAQLRGSLVDVRYARDQAAGRGEVFGALVAGVVLR
jgi:hypothetical protein